MDNKENIDVMQSDFSFDGLDQEIAEISTQVNAEFGITPADNAPASRTITADMLQNQNFTEDEIAQINEVAGKINLHDTNTLITYGAAAQKRLANFSDAALNSVQTKDMNEIGNILGGLVADLKYNPQDTKGFFGIFKKGKRKAEELKAHYAKVGTNVESVTKILENHQRILIKDVAMLDQLFEKNKVYFKEISMYIAAGKVALERATNEELPALNQKAQMSGLTEDIQVANDFASMCDRFDKKIHDLEITREICLQNAPQIRLVQGNDIVMSDKIHSTIVNAIPLWKNQMVLDLEITREICLQNAPQIRLVQGNDIVMSDKIHSTIVNAIPLWKNQMVLALGMVHSQEAIKAQRMVSDATNDMLRKNAEILHQTTTQTAIENERSVVDMETLKYTNEQLIATLDELVKIQADGRAKRKAAENELAKLENELKAKMIEVSSTPIK